MRIGEAFPSRFLKATDLQGKEYELVMSHVEIVDVGDSEHKPVLYFARTEKGLVLNKTNAEMIALMYGDETDLWSGHKITIKPDKVQFGGRIVDAIRIVWKQHAPAGPASPLAGATAPTAPATPTPAKAFQAQQEKAALGNAAQAPASDDPLGDDSIPF